MGHPECERSVFARSVLAAKRMASLGWSDPDLERFLLRGVVLDRDQATTTSLTPGNLPSKMVQRRMALA